MKKIFTVGILQAIALVVLLIGAAGSLDFMYDAGRNQKSFLLISLFTVWVLSPFLALLFANLVSKSWSRRKRLVFYFLMLFITLGSLVCYSGVLNISGTKPAFKFLFVPFVSWLLIAIAIPISRRLARKEKASDLSQI